MNRRKFILGTGAAAAGGASLLGSGAFSSVQAKRDVQVDVVGDRDAFLRLAPCTDEEDEPLPNGDYVDFNNGQIALLKMREGAVIR